MQHSSLGIFEMFSLHVGPEQLHFPFIKIQLTLVILILISLTRRTLGTHLELELTEIRKTMQFLASGSPIRR